ncbi:ATP-dependent helicase BRM [Apostasia shenzhenica]|uniref:ATP-dependent helicase BRM n=1 Tax=Apostasia shenzhenica TaxID=1088818 RepID=A0A2H9ZRE7_9ASPA|nr:ATP-dependent helicase BRM [Apostasia shenzhenica]
MQPPGGAAGRGRAPAGAPPAPPGRSSSSSSASPSSSSSAVSASTHVGFESVQQQQFALRQRSNGVLGKGLHAMCHLLSASNVDLCPFHIICFLSPCCQLGFELDDLFFMKFPLCFIAVYFLFFLYNSSLCHICFVSIVFVLFGAMHGVIGGNNFPSSSGFVPGSQSPRNLPHEFATQLREKRQGVHDLEQQQNLMHQAYIQFAMQAAQQQQRSQGSLPVQNQGKFGVMAPPARDQDIQSSNSKMQELISNKAANQAQLVRPNNTVDQKNELKPSLTSTGQFQPQNTIRPMRSVHSQGVMGNNANNQLMMAQLQAMQAWAIERNIDLTHPANASLLAQFLPILQSNRLAALQKSNESSIPIQQPSLSISKPEVVSSPVASENSTQENSASNLSGQARVVRNAVQTSIVNPLNMQMQQSPSIQSSASQNEIVEMPIVVAGNSASVVHRPQGSLGSGHNIDLSSAKIKCTGSESAHAQIFKHSQQMANPTFQSSFPSNEVLGSRTSPAYVGSAQAAQQNIGFTRQQLHVLKAQILAFRRIKRGERALPPEVLQAISPPPLDSSSQAVFLSSGMNKLERTAGSKAEEHEKHPETDQVSQLASLMKGRDQPKQFTVEDKAPATSVKPVETTPFEAVQKVSAGKTQETCTISVKAEQDDDQVSSFKDDNSANKVKSVSLSSASVDVGQVKKHANPNISPPQDLAAKKYHGPLFDFPFYTRKYDLLTLTNLSNSNNLTLAYDVKDLLYEEGKVSLSKKRTENLRKISNLLAVNIERKRIKPDLILRLQIEEKKLHLLDLQTRLRDEVEEQQQEIMLMPDRPYRKFVRQCERQRIELVRQVQQLQKAARERQLKSIFQWRKKLLETHWAIRDARTTRNRGVAKYHERMLREFSKRKDDDRNRRMEALKNNDVDRYREMLLEQQTSIPGDAAQRYVVLSSFLSQTEEYLHKLGAKITTTKKQQEVEEAANAVATAARAHGLSEEEVKAAAACAREEVMIRNTFSEMNAPRDRSSVNKYYNLAHAVNERVVRQPSLLRAGTLRDYQLVGLQWMLSLYNNKLNGILADEMGLGKTVQVMALIAYLMEFKGNYGPHLIIVPNAVLVNWKSELHNWLPSASCIFYVGVKDERSRLFSHEVYALKFNVLVTTYEFVMYDRSKLSRIDWKYIIIDEAQRMKDRESVLARDLDRYRCQRRLLLTGTPLQNDLKELWSLLNLLLPEVFDNRKAFHDWFSKPFQKDGPSHNSEEDDWLETEKKVIVIHRLHQILEPFMLRRRLEDVEGSLPPKVSIVLRCRMSAMQGAIYDWIKSTGTVRVDPEDELCRAEKNPMYQIKMYKNLNNKCMELRKACNHPLLNYPYFSDYSRDFLVRSCGKLWILDRILLKLQKAGHRVLLFSTMTKLLDILEEYLQWRRLVYRRIDGTTSLEDRESAIVDFNSPDSDCFIFLLSIRAAGRGLNLQSADTVVIYDPDPNPQNEEQAVARAHRIGQTREVKVIYMEAVVDKITSFQKEDEQRNGGSGDSDDDLAGKDRYMGSIESLIRNNIQQYKIDMADEVINAGRFDQRTTHEERRMTLETLLHDEERYQETVHDVPSLQEVNRMIARSEEEVELFDQMDEEFDWTGEMIKHNQVPKWLRVGFNELNVVVASLSKKPSKNILGSGVGVESGEMISGLSPTTTERKSGRPRRLIAQKYSNYMEIDEDDGEDSDVCSDERSACSSREEDREIGEIEDEDLSGALDLQTSNNKDLLEEDALICDGGFDFLHDTEQRRDTNIGEEAGSSDSYLKSRSVGQPGTPSISLRKFGSLSELDARPGVLTLKPDDVEEGEIAISGDSHLDIQQSGSWNYDREDGEDEHVLQPKLKRKRSKRLRPRYAVEKLEMKSSNDRTFFQHGSQPLLHVDHDDDMLSRTDTGVGEFSEPFLSKAVISSSQLKQRHNFQNRRVPVLNSQKSGGFRYLSGSTEVATDVSRESRNSQDGSGPGFIGRKMSESMQRKCKNVISKLQRRIDKEGCQIIPMFYDAWKKNEYSNSVNKHSKISNPFDLRRIDHRIDNFEYAVVAEFISDMQLMLRSLVQYFDYSQEAKYEARKLQDIFFEIMKIAFPDSDFHEVKMALSFPSTGFSGTAAKPQALKPCSKQPKTIEARMSPSFPKSTTRKSTPIARSTPLDEGRARVRAPQSVADSSLLGPLLTHPGDLVICKKKRKERDKSSVRARMGAPPLASPVQGINPFSRPNTGRFGSSSSISTNLTPRSGGHKDSVLSNRGSESWFSAGQQGGGGGGAHGLEEVQWAKPVKRMRTDSGKRRPNLM